MPLQERAVRTFLVHPPKPARIVVQTEEGPQDVPPGGTGTGRSWASIARTIVAMKSERIECYDVANKLLRALSSEDDDSNRTGWQPGLGLPNTIPDADPETVRLLHFANLLYRATEFSTTLAFEKMVDLFERMSDRSDAIEARLERTEQAYRRTLNEQVRDALEQAAEQAQEGAVPADNPLGEIVNAFLGGMHAGRQGAPLAKVPPPNGKGDATQ